MRLNESSVDISSLIESATIRHGEEFSKRLARKLPPQNKCDLPTAYNALISTEGSFRLKPDGTIPQPVIGRKRASPPSHGTIKLGEFAY